MMMRILMHGVVVLALVCGLSACGSKGKLKTPEQIQADAAKKERRKTKMLMEQPSNPDSVEKAPDIENSDIKSSNDQAPRDPAEDLVGTVKP
jgi:predicted small lipoprotein YifL